MTPRRTPLVATLATLVVLGAACTPAPSAPPVTAPPVVVEVWQTEMLAAVNAERAAVGASPLVMCPTLERAAQDHSADQAARRTMSHTGGDGSTLRIRVERAGYVGWTGIAENVAAGYGGVASVMAGWMGSAGHRTNLLNASYRHLGVGSARSSDGTPYWTQVFGRDGAC